MSQASPRFVDNYNEEDRITPAFLTLGQKYSIAIGSTVVLPCKINETGTFYIRIHVINFRFKFFRPSQQQRIDRDLYETGQLAFLFDFDRRCCCCTRRVKFDENVRFVDLNMSTYCVAIDTGYACLSLHSVPFFFIFVAGTLIVSLARGYFYPSSQNKALLCVLVPRRRIHKLHWPMVARIASYRRYPYRYT